MKRIYLLAGLVLAVTLWSCSGTKKLQKGTLKGTWTVTSVRIDGVDPGTQLKTTAFDDVAIDCFNGSQWSLPNNGFGTYNITSAGNGCMAGERRIIWSVRTSNGVDYFNFKKMDGVKNSKAREVEEGYSLEVTSVGDGAFTARSPIVFEGRTIYIVYNFVKQ